MQKDRKKPDLKQESLKVPPFEVPEGYFEGFSARLSERISEEETSKVPVRRIGYAAGFRVAIAAAVLGMALISYSIIRYTTARSGSNGTYPEITLLEQLQDFDDDLYLYELMENGTGEMDEEEAFTSQAIDYLATNDVEMVLIYE